MMKIIFLIAGLFLTTLGFGQTAQEWFDRGTSLLKYGEYVEAIAKFNNAIALNSRFASAYGNRGVAKYYLHDYRGSILDFNKVIAIDPDDEKAFSYRGLSKIQFEDYAGAIADCNRAIELDPNYADPYCNRGEAKALSGQVDSGCYDLSKAGELGCERAYDQIQKYCQEKKRKRLILTDSTSVVSYPYRKYFK